MRSRTTTDGGSGCRRFFALEPPWAVCGEDRCRHGGPLGAPFCETARVYADGDDVHPYATIELRGVLVRAVALDPLAAAPILFILEILSSPCPSDRDGASVEVMGFFGQD